MTEQVSNAKKEETSISGKPALPGVQETQTAIPSHQRPREAGEDDGPDSLDSELFIRLDELRVLRTLKYLGVENSASGEQPTDLNKQKTGQAEATKPTNPPEPIETKSS